MFNKCETNKKQMVKVFLLLIEHELIIIYSDLEHWPNSVYFMIILQPNTKRLRFSSLQETITDDSKSV